jgi:hypothetical protein
MKNIDNKNYENNLKKNFNQYMISKCGKFWKESIENNYIKAYKEAFRAGFKSGIKFKNITI